MPDRSVAEPRQAEATQCPMHQRHALTSSSWTCSRFAREPADPGLSARAAGSLGVWPDALLRAQGVAA
jgi:hypothetical protein